jgi:hypothetical protein
MRDKIMAMGVDEIKEIEAIVKERKAELKEEVKARKAAIRESVEADNKAILENVEEGSLVKFIFKGEETVATFVKVTEKRFTVKIDAVTKRSIMFDKFIEVVTE